MVHWYMHTMSEYVCFLSYVCRFSSIGHVQCLISYSRMAINRKWLQMVQRRHWKNCVSIYVYICVPMRKLKVKFDHKSIMLFNGIDDFANTVNGTCERERGQKWMLFFSNNDRSNWSICLSMKTTSVCICLCVACSCSIGICHPLIWIDVSQSYVIMQQSTQLTS